MTAPGWQTGPAGAGGLARRAGPLAAVAAGVLAAAVGLLALYDPPVPADHFVVTQSAAAAPVPFAAADHAALAPSGGLPTNPTRDQLRLALTRPPGRAGLVAVVTGRLTAGPDGRGELAGDADGADSPRNRLPLDELLARLRGNRPLLVVLNLHGPAAGLLADAALAATPDDQRSVLVAVSHGTHGIGGRSPVGYYLARGLAAADGSNPAGDRDGRVTARELAAFVRESVGRWAEAAGVPGPAVELVGSGPDFFVGFSTTPPEETPAAVSYPAELAEAWTRRDAATDDHPAAVRRFEAAVLDAETRWAGGGRFADRLTPAVTTFTAAVARPSGAGLVVLPTADPAAADQLRAALDAADPAAPDSVPLPPTLKADAATLTAALASDPPPAGPALRWAGRMWAALDPAAADPLGPLTRAVPDGRAVRLTVRLDRAADDPHVFPWVRAALADADAAVTAAVARLAATGFAADPDAAVAAADGLVRQLLDVRDRHRAARRALIAGGRWGVPRPLLDQLAAALQPPASPPDVSALLTAAAGWADAASPVRLAADDRAAEFAATAGRRDRLSPTEVDALLRTARPSADERAALWAVRLARQARAEEAVRGLDEAGLPAWADPRRPAVTAPAPPIVADDPPDPPAADWVGLLTWHLHRAEFASLDPADLRSAPLVAAHRRRAAELRAAVPSAAPLVLVEVGRPTPLVLTGPATTTVEVRGAGPTEPLPVHITPEAPVVGWLQTAAVTAALQPGRAVTLSLDVSPGPKVGSATAAGLLLRVTAGGRHQFRRLPVDVSAVANRLTLLVRTDTGSALGWAIRPNGQPMTAKLVLANPGPTPRTVVVRLPALGRESAPVTVAPGGTTVVAFAPGPPPTSPAVPFELPLEWPVELVDPISKAVVQTVPLRLTTEDPAGYVAVGPVRLTGVELTVPAALVRQVGAVPVEVRLLGDAAIEPTAGGLLRGTLTAAAPALKLYAKGLPAGGLRVAVAIDGVPRAARFTGTVSRGGGPVEFRPDTAPAVRIACPEFATDAAPLPVKLEADGPPGAAVTLHIGEGAGTDRRYPPLPAGVRRAAVAVDPAGGLTATATASDPAADLDVARLVGVKELTADLTLAGNVLATARRRVVFDPLPPAGVRLVGVPAVVPRGKPLAVTAAFDVPASGVKEVRFFVGKPAGSAPPQGAVAVPGKVSGGRATATLPAVELPTVDLSVVVTSGAGVSAAGTVSVDTADPAELAKPKPGSVRGVVVEGELPQPGLTVQVFATADPKAPKATVKTGDGGTFEAADLPPGKYRVVCEKAVSGRTAEAAADVPAGGVAAVRLALLLK